MHGDTAHRRLIEERLLKRRLEAVTSTAPFVALASLTSVLFLLFVMAPSAPWSFLGIWGGAVAGLFLLRTGPFARFLRRRFFKDGAGGARSGSSAQSRYRLLNALMCCSSLVWAIGMPVLTSYASSGQFSALVLVGTAMTTGVLLMHRYVPTAAMFHVTVMTVGGCISLLIAEGWQAWPVLVLALIYAVVLVRAIVVNDLGFVEGIANRVSHEESENTIRLLLKEYEVQASDWLWTVGPNGNMREVSPRFAEICGRPADQLEGARFADLFVPGARRDRLETLIEQRRAFTDELMVREEAGGLRYWRLSARPRSDGRMTGMARDVTDNHVNEERVQYMAHFDELTGLANRYSFNERLAVELGRGDGSDEAPASLTLFYCDLDDFKGVNDTYGHQAGDQLLREVATRLEGELRADDMVARLSGDEFVVLLTITAGDAIVIERAHRLLAALREPYTVDGNTAIATASIGIARAGPGMGPEELVHRADLALQEAKRKGRDQLALFAPELDAAMKERRQVEHDLRYAIAGTDAASGGGLLLHYQPLVCLRDGSVTAYEALVRWNHPTRGLLMPDQFLTVAEETGLIVPLGDWVIANALRELSQLNGDFRVSINLSPSQLRAPSLLPTVSAALARGTIDPDRLEFEVTEHVLLSDSEAALATLERLRDMGAHIALDDFGTGYSSLGYLRRFRFDRIKIDRGFVHDLADSASARAIVSAITQLARALGMKTTAEGVEGAGQIDLLRELGCDEGQGFLIQEPAPLAVLRAAERGSERGDVVDYREARQRMRPSAAS